MKKIYVYVGQLRDWMLRMAQRVKGLLGVRVMNKKMVEEVATCSLDSEETTRFACNSHPVAPYSLYEQRESSPNETLLVRAERYLWERYEFRYNVLAKCYEYREVSKKTPIAPLPLRGLPTLPPPHFVLVPLKEGQCGRMQENAVSDEHH